MALVLLMPYGCAFICILHKPGQNNIKPSNMKLKSFILTLCVLHFASSCIKDEPLNSEADILSFILPDTAIFSQPLIANDIITLFVNAEADLEHATPKIEITEGAKLIPDLPEYDLTKQNTFEVKSQDGQYSKIYTIKIVSRMAYDYKFDKWMPKTSDYGNNFPRVATEQEDGTLIELWSSGNYGVNNAFGGPISRKTFPTKDTIIDDRTVALLRTIRGKTVPKMGLIPVFPGSLFYGVYKLDMESKATAAQGVRFGQPFPDGDGAPVRFSGLYKYTPGQEYLNPDGELQEGKIDECTIRAFLYQTRKGAATANISYLGEDYLCGLDDLFNAEQLVAMADMEDCTEKREWTEFDMEFKYTTKKIDFDNYDYRIAIVFSASKRGDFYEGAIGSTLIIDHAKITLEKK